MRVNTSPVPDGEAGSQPNEQSSPSSSSDDPSALKPPRSATRGDILQFVWAATAAAPLPAGWSFLSPVERVRCLRQDPQDLVELLRREFDVNDLLKARALWPTKGTELRLSPVFGGPPSKFLFRVDGNGRPIDVVSEWGTLSSNDPPAVRLALDRRSESFARKTISIPVVSTGDDMQVLWGLGCDSLPAAGLHKFSYKHFSKLFSRSSSNFDCTLTISCWQITKLIDEPCPFMRQVLERLWKIEDLHPYRLHRLFGAWQIQDAELRKLRSAVQIADCKSILAVFRRSRASSPKSPVDVWNGLLDRAPRDFCTARNELKHEMDQFSVLPNAAAVRAALDRLYGAHDRDIVSKFDAKISASADPTDASILLLGSELAQHVLETDPLVVAARRMTAGSSNCYSGELSAEALNDRLRVAAMLTKMRRELNR